MNVVEKVPAAYIPVIESKFDAILRRAEKKGLNGDLWYEISGEYCKVPNKRTKRSRQTFVDVTIDGCVPNIDGWELIAKLTIEESHVAVLVAPGKDLPKSFRDSKGLCDHCEVRRPRKDTFVIHNIETDEYMEIGRNCMKDFFPSRNVVMMIEYLKFVEAMTNFDSEYIGNLKIEMIYDLTDVVAMSAAVIDADGWVSKTVAMESEDKVATSVEIASQLMLSYNYRPIQYYGPQKERVITPENKHSELASKVIDFIRNEMKGNNDYVYNMKGFFGSDTIKHKYISFVASSIASYNKNKEFVAAKAKEVKPGTTGGYVGELKERLELDVEIISLMQVNGYYGSSTMVRMVDTDDNLFVTFAAGDFGYDEEIGDKIIIKGTIKKHQEYKGAKQNMLTRVKKIK